MNYPRLAIPTYRRSDTISLKTLRYLKLVEYPRDKIYLFVIPEEEAIYREKVSADLYGQIVVGVLGLAAQRNFISQFFDENEIIVCMDDDVLGIKSAEVFAQILQRGLTGLDQSCGLFGIMPNDDARKFKDKTTRHLSHILGSFFICRNHKDLIITYTDKEDMERSILYFKKYGVVLRYQNAGVVTSYLKGTGGLQTNERSDRIKECILNLMEKYPECCRLVQKKKGEDIVLNWRYLFKSYSPYS